MPVALTLTLTDCVSPHLLGAFVYVFRGVSEGERIEAEKIQARKPPRLNAAHLS